MPLVLNLNQLKQNIINFNSEILMPTHMIYLREKISQTKRWYGFINGGVYYFGPSKYCGYRGMNTSLYQNCKMYQRNRFVLSTLIGTHVFSGLLTEAAIWHFLPMLTLPTVTTADRSALQHFAASHARGLRRNHSLTMLP